jgi:hypothetical protein
MCVLLAGCGGKAASGPAIGNSADPGDTAVIRVDPAARQRDCPAGVLEQLIPGWAEYMEYSTLEPGLDACLRGNLIGDSVVVYASAQPAPDSQSEEGWPMSRVIATADGKVLLEGPPGGGNYMMGAAQLEALADLDGDGVHEIIETDQADVMISIVRVYQVKDGAMVDAGSVATYLEEPGTFLCTGEWTVGPANADGKRPLVVTVKVEEEAEEEPGPYDHAPESDLPTCPGAGVHRYWLEGGALAE